MKASEVIKALQTLDPDEEIMFTWWERELVSGWFSNDKLIDIDKWHEAVDRFESWDLQETADDITRMIEELEEES